jgi:hypothetical protein
VKKDIHVELKDVMKDLQVHQANYDMNNIPIFLCKLNKYIFF